MRLRDLLILLWGLAACAPAGLADGALPRPTSRDALRPDSPSTNEPPPNFGPTDTVERFSETDGGVLVHFTRSGQHHVPLADTNDSGVPDFVEQVAATYTQVLAQYHGPWGFRPPPDDSLVPDDNGGDGRFDVYLVDFALRADGAFRRECLASDPVHCPGYMVQENDFAGYGYPSVHDGIVTVSSHEYFHAVQAGYASQQGVNITEGTAVWATERFDPALDDLEAFAGGYLTAPDRSLDQEPSTAVDAYAYGLGLFFECLTAQRGPDAVRDLWARLDAGASWLGTLERNLAEDGGVSLPTVMERCSDWNLFTGARSRLGFGHNRAAALPLATVVNSSAVLQVPRARMFRAASRYYRVTALPSDAVAWWRTAPDAPDGGADSLRVRLVRDVPGTPELVPLSLDQPTAVGASTAFILVSNVATAGPSVPIGLCVGAPAFVEGCRMGDAGVSEDDAGIAGPDGGTPDAGASDAGADVPSSPASCGCSASGGSLALLGFLIFFSRRRWRALAATVAVMVPLVAAAQSPADAGVGSHAEALLQDAGPRVDLAAAGATEPIDAGAEALPPGAGQLAAEAPTLTTVVTGGSFGAGATAPVDAGEPLIETLIGGEAVKPETLTTVVTGGRLPQQLKDSTVAVEVITRRQLQESGARDLAEALQARPGLETTPNVGATALRMGGLGPEYNLVMIDGQRLAGRLNGGVDLSRLTLENIEQIEIVKGPSSVLWGSDAIAGTVNIITRAPSKPLSGSATASYGRLNQVSAAASGETGGEKWGLTVSGGYERRDAYDLDSSTLSTNGSSLDQVQGSIGALLGSRSRSEPAVDARLDYTRRTQHGVDLGAGGVVFDRATRDNVLQGRVGGRLPVGKGEISATASASWVDRRFVNDQRDSTVLDDVQDSRDSVAQLDLLASQTFFTTHTALVGGQALVELFDSPRLAGGHGQRFRGALFTQDSWSPQLSVPLTVAVGVRADFDSHFGLAGTPRLAARVDPMPSLALRLSTGLGFRAPSFQELFIDFENPSVGYVIVGNTALRPERSWGTSLGAQWSPGRWLVSLNLFWNELWDMIGITDVGAGETLRYQYVNRSRTRSRGLEGSLGTFIVDGLMVEVGYTLTDSRDLTAGLPLEAQAPHRAFAQVRWRMRSWGLTANLRCSVTGERPFLADDTTVRWTSPFAMVDARIAKTLGSHVELFVAGMNLAGAGGPDLPIPPRSVFGGLTVRD